MYKRNYVRKSNLKLKKFDSKWKKETGRKDIKKQKTTNKKQQINKGKQKNLKKWKITRKRAKEEYNFFLRKKNRKKI